MGNVRKQDLNLITSVRELYTRPVIFENTKCGVQGRLLVKDCNYNGILGDKHKVYQACDIGANLQFSTPTVLDIAQNLVINSITLTGLTASTVLYANAGKTVVSIANGAGYLTNDGVGGMSWTPQGHDILSARHSDTVPAAVVDGDMIIGNVTPKWSKLAILIPAANVRNVLGVDNGELRPSWKTALDATNPTTIGISDAAVPGTSLIFSHRDHQHASPATWTATAHAIDGATHTLAGSTAGFVLRATAATTFSFGTIGNTSLANLGTQNTLAKFGLTGLAGSLLSETANDVVIGSTKRFGLGAGKGGMTFTDAATDTISFDDCNVGIGCVPTVKLEVVVSSGTAVAISNANVGMSIIPEAVLNDRTIRFTNNSALTTGGWDFFATDGAFNKSCLKIQNNGFVGIGTTAPNNLIHAYRSSSDTTALLRLEDFATGDASIQFRVGDAISWFAGVDNSDSDKFKFATGGFDSSVKMTIQTDGNVGFGTEIPVSLTEIQGGLTTTGAILTLGTKEPTVVANDVLGRINFYAPLEADGGDAIAVAASIVAISEDTFSATVNKTSLLFQTGASEVATTKMCLTSAGRFCVGDIAPECLVHIYAGAHGGAVTADASTLLCIEKNDDTTFEIMTPNNKNGRIWFTDQDAAARGRINYSHSSDYMDLYAAGTQAIRLGANGNAGIGGVAFDGTVVNYLAILNGTFPSAHTDNQIYIGSADNTSNSLASLSLYCEEPIRSGDLTCHHYMTIMYNGIEHKFPCLPLS